MSAIEWTDETWNPTVGCARVSPGCDNCYAEKVAARNLSDAHRGLTEDGKWTGEVRCLPDRLDTPLRWRKPRRVFVDSMSDLFHPDVPDGFITRVLDVIYKTPQHTYQILTKRPQRMASFMQRWVDRSGDRDQDRDGGRGLPPMPRGPEAVRATYSSGRSQLFAAMLDSMGEPPPDCAYPLYDWQGGPRFWPELPFNLWLGVSVENQRYADLRIPHLLRTPAAVRFLSCEPLLGPVDLSAHLHIGEEQRWLPSQPEEVRTRTIARLSGHDAMLTREYVRWVCSCGVTSEPFIDTPQGDCEGDFWRHQREACGIDWVIAGGESGPAARPMHPQWARDLRDQCVTADVPFFFKQWGEWVPEGHPAFVSAYGVDADASDPRWQCVELTDPMTTYVPMYRAGKKAAGRELDGRTWDEQPGGAGTVPGDCP